MDLAFFGLTLDSAPKIRKNLFSTIHEIVFHGKGGYSWETIYNMPIWLRNFTFSKTQSYFEDEAETQKRANKGKNTEIDFNNPVSPTSNVIQPPDYATKMAKK